MHACVCAVTSNHDQNQNGCHTFPSALNDKEILVPGAALGGELNTSNFDFLRDGGVTPPT